MKRSVKDHLHDTVDVAVHRSQGANVDAQTTCEAGAHGFNVELFALDLAGLDNIFCERQETGLVAEGQPDIRQAAQQEPLPPTDFSQETRQGCQIIAPAGPVIGFPDIPVIAAIHAAIMTDIRRNRKLSQFSLNRTFGMNAIGAGLRDSQSGIPSK